MVHNGIEYGDMQMICEAYDLMRKLLGMTAAGDRRGLRRVEHGRPRFSFLIEITADILAQKRPGDRQAASSTSCSTPPARRAPASGPASTRSTWACPPRPSPRRSSPAALSAVKDERVAASQDPQAGPDSQFDGDKKEFIEAIHDALYCSKICSYAQGFQLMREAQKEYDWKLDFGEIAQIWRGGCIIRARFLQKITEAYERDRELANLLLDPYFKARPSQNARRNWRKVVATAALHGVARPDLRSRARLLRQLPLAPACPPNLLQAQRDYFGAHTYERIDQPRGKFFHIDWPEPGRPQIEI